MIQLNSKLFVFDNSGVRTAKCIKLFNKNKNCIFLLVSIKTLRTKQKNKPKIKKGAVVFAYVLKKTIPTSNFSGLKIKTNVNGVILVNKQLQPISSRVIGVVPKQFKLSGLKNLSLSGVLV